ncbi:MAG: hypothetical protein R3B70_28325, partial [Polyangiaceae bacterium]
ALAGEGRFSEVWRCDLARARDLSAACDVVLQAMGAPGAGPAADPEATLALALEPRGDVLLWLDEAEALVPALEQPLARLLAGAPGASLLITSREPLRAEGESVIEVGPLSLESGAAVELFVMCTQRARSVYTLTDDDAPFVLALVRELDGLPLAIELCAPRMAVMGARALLHRMKSRFDLLRRKPKGEADRHATLAAAIDASWSSLDPDAQSALAQAAVFRGGFSAETAESVIDLSMFPDAPPLLDLLQALRDRSLLMAAVAHVPGELRLSMLSSVRAFALEKLASQGPAARAAVEERHARAVLTLAESHERGLSTPRGAEHRAGILALRDELVEVIERVLGKGPVSARTAEPALRALLVLANLSPYDGPPEAFASAVGPVLTATRDSGADPRLSARALYARGALLLSRGDVRSGSRDLVQSLAVARTLGDDHLAARATHTLGEALAARGEAVASREHFERAASMFAELGDVSGSASATLSLASSSLREGRLDEALALASRALSGHRAASDPFGEASALLVLGRVACDRDDLPAALAHLEASRASATSAGSRRAAALALGWLGFALQLARRFDEARSAFEGAAAELGELGLVPSEALFTGLLGVLLREMSEPAEAFTRLRFASERIAGTGHDAHHALFLFHLAELDAAVGRDEAAVSLRQQARTVLGNPPDRAVESVLAGSAPNSGVGRIAARIARSAAPDCPPPPPADALLLGPSGLWFRTPHAERVSLDRRRQLARMLDRLAEERLSHPSAALDWQALVAAAWPGERVLPEAAAHRVRVAISTLRKLGLRDLLHTTEEGYLLDPSVPALRAT